MVQFDDGFQADNCVLLQTVHDGRIYTVKLYCDQNYPGKVKLTQLSTAYPRWLSFIAVELLQLSSM